MLMIGFLSVLLHFSCRFYVWGRNVFTMQTENVWNGICYWDSPMKSFLGINVMFPL